MVLAGCAQDVLQIQVQCRPRACTNSVSPPLWDWGGGGGAGAHASLIFAASWHACMQPVVIRCDLRRSDISCAHSDQPVTIPRWDGEKHCDQ